ncbi:MAG TPA: cohesin domain-containing protein, partial [Legionellaceae bacterium]|nr:cohesin domain-containing protein [Legionellaceae bacterium]
LLLIVFLLIITGIFVYIAVSQNSIKTTPKQPSQRPVPTQKPSQAFTTLAFSPSVVTLSSNSGSVAILIDTHGEKNKITAVQLELSYDPTRIANITAKPGTFLDNPFALISPSDPKKTGRVTYALAISPSAKGKSGSGVVATLSFQKLFSTGNTVIHVLPSSLVTSEGIAQSVLKNTIDVTITAGAGVPSSSSTSSTLKR